MDMKVTIIDPAQHNAPDTAVIQKVASENERLPNGEHEKAVKAFYFSDSIASGIGKDFAFVEKIPQLINQIIENKSWECLYVSKGVVTPYYCRYTKGNDSENFKAFIAAKRPNGLGTTIETLDRLLEAELEVQRKFREIFVQSHQGERTDLATSALRKPKLFNPSHEKRIRAANRAGEAIPVIGELLDRGLIAIDIAAKLGRDIKDPDNLTAEEREYVDRRDLVGLRIKEYINTNAVPDDEDKEPAYRRKLNEFVKDLLGIKNRSKSVRMDNPKKAAQKLLQFYQGEKLQELLEYLGKGINQDINSQKKDNGSQPNVTDFRNTPNEKSSYDQGLKSTDSSAHLNGNNSSHREKSSTGEISENSSVSKSPLTLSELAERLRRKPKTINAKRNEGLEIFLEWTKKKDPDGIAWQRSDKKQGKSYLFFPVEEAQNEEKD